MLFMSKSKFLEGAILGLLAGVVGAVWLLQDEEDADEENHNEQETTTQSTKKKKKTVNVKPTENTEEVVNKTLDAIENGFDKISKMIDDRKAKK